MSGANPPIEPGLHFLATPIGAARDITLKALDLLRAADVLAAEDTRSLRRLMEIHGIQGAGRTIVAYHDHNAPAVRPGLLRALAAGKSVAYASEAGTPLVADPGYQLARVAIENGHRIFAAPGPSAVLAALTVSGLPSDRFMFAGFPPQTKSARRKFLEELKDVPATVILFESPKRVNRLLGELTEIWGDERHAALCREMTKRFEEVIRGTIGEIVLRIGDTTLRGECVLVIDRKRAVDLSPDASRQEMEAMLSRARESLSLREAVAQVALETGLPRRQVYQAALRQERDK